MKAIDSMKKIILSMVFISVTALANAQLYTGYFRTVANNADYHQFIRSGNGAAVYVNQLINGQPIMRLSSGTATANQGVVFTVQYDGSVGIGTTDPQAKLAVEGNILAKEVKVKTDITVPDYVFEPGYELPPLAEIEAYVKEHRHLPEVPSAAEIERDGLDLAEMNLLLLKKVEELTLHLIGQQEKLEELDGLKKEVQVLKGLINNRL